MTLFSVWWNPRLQLLVLIYLWITISHFLSFCLLNHFGVNNIWAVKIGYANTLSLGTNSCKKRNMTTLKSRALIKKKRCVTCVAGYNDSRARYRAFSQSCQPKKKLFGFETKLKESILKSNNQINSTVTTRTWVSSKEWIITLPNTGLVYELTNGDGTRLFEW